ncbi:MAG: glycosyltransferase [Bacillota bacterium]|nr:glycosyltransferase [Bacillota bacterium]
MASKHATKRQTKKQAQARRLKNEKQHQISLCMIVKNEEEFLPGCLDSVKGVVDEIIIVDTGSTDRTVEIARQYGAKVYHYEWNDDFAAARNESLKHSTCGWILVLDADERLESGAAQALKATAAGFCPKAIYAARIINRSGVGNETEHYFPRFFPNHVGIQYEGLIHERPSSRTSELFSGSRLPRRLKGFTVIHYGYQQDVVKGRDKMRRNIALLERILETEDNLYYRYKLGSMLLSAGRISEAVCQIERVLAALESMDQEGRRRVSVGRVDLLLLLADAYERQGKRTDATRLIDRAIQILPGSKEALHQKAVQLFRDGRYEEARDVFLAVASSHPQDRADTSGEQLVFDTSLDTWKPYTMAARCSIRLGDVLAAVEVLAAAAGFVPRSDEYLETVREVLDQTGHSGLEPGGMESPQVERLRAVLHEEAARKAAEGDRMFAEGEIARALELYARSARLSVTGNGAMLARIAANQLRLGKIREAFSTYLQALRSLPGDVESLNLLIELTEAFKALTGDKSVGVAGGVGAEADALRVAN